MGKRPFGEVARLYANADAYWPLIEAHYYQINLLELPLTRFLNHIYAWLVMNMDSETREKFDIELSMPLPGERRKVSQTEQEEEGAAFMAAMGALRTG